MKEDEKALGVASSGLLGETERSKGRAWVDEPPSQVSLGRGRKSRSVSIWSPHRMDREEFSQENTSVAPGT